MLREQLMSLDSVPLHVTPISQVGPAELTESSKIGDAATKEFNKKTDYHKVHFSTNYTLGEFGNRRRGGN